MADVLGRPLAVANAGVDLFADELERQGVRVERVEWRPPEPGTEEALARLALDAAERSRAPTTRRSRGSRPRSRSSSASAWRATCCPDIGDRTILHAGPPIEWADMSGPLRGAVIGAAVYEGLAERPRGRRAPRRRRRVRVRPVPRARRGRADGRRRQPVDADVRDRERRRTATARSARSTRGSARCCATAPTTPRCSTRLALDPRRARARVRRALARLASRSTCGR